MEDRKETVNTMQAWLGTRIYDGWIVVAVAAPTRSGRGLPGQSPAGVRPDPGPAHPCRRDLEYPSFRNALPSSNGTHYLHPSCGPDRSCRPSATTIRG
jgi:hypothetical protein